MNIYLPAELAEEVRSADLNVSQVAQDALRAELARRELVGDATGVVARLRGTIGEEERRRREQFYEYGKEWAQSTATVAELEAFEAWLASDWETWIFPEGHSLREFMAEHENWRKVSKVTRGPAFEALIEGALAIWEQVREKVYEGGA